MPPINRLYEKKESYRDAKLFVIICEGGKREPDYFGFFDKITQKIKVIAAGSIDGRTAPHHLIENAKETIKKLDFGEEDELWIVFDRDRWEESDIYNLIKECREKKWLYAISNPCFEVWLYYHLANVPSEIQNPDTGRSWKQHIETNLGGFSSVVHPKLIRLAITNSENNYSEINNLPNVGSTQVHLLGKNILPLIKEFLEE
jgi:hypothetical protein